MNTRQVGEAPKGCRQKTKTGKNKGPEALVNRTSKEYSKL